MAGACATILKAAFADAPFRTLAEGKMTVDVASDDGLGLVSISPDPGITIFGEINKLASNIALRGNPLAVGRRVGNAPRGGGGPQRPARSKITTTSARTLKASS